MPRTPEQIQAAISALVEEVAELGKEAERQGYQGIRYYSTHAALYLGKASDSMRLYMRQMEQDRAAVEQMRELTAMQRKAGAFSQVEA